MTERSDCFAIQHLGERKGEREGGRERERYMLITGKEIVILFRYATIGRERKGERGG